jgi:acyl-CoA thioester hydrolase
VTNQSDASPRDREFRHRTSCEVRFRDLDAFGHVNNAVFSTYVELARIRYLLDVLQPERPFERMPLILAHLAIDFRSPIQFGEEVAIETRVTEVGRSSFGMRHRMTADGRLAAELDTVLVAYDYATARPMPVPDAWRERLAAHEGRSLERQRTDARPVPAGSPT